MTHSALIEIDKIIATITERERRARSHAEARVRDLGAQAGNERWHREHIPILYSQEAL